MKIGLREEPGAGDIMVFELFQCGAGVWQLPSAHTGNEEDQMSHVAIVARVTVKEGKADEYVAAFAPLLEQAKK